MTHRFVFNHPSFDAVSGKEWLITNGIGGYASSTMSGANTRRYHGLLVASLHPPVDRYVLVSAIEEKVVSGGREYLLSTHVYPGTIHPRGHHYLTSFERYPFPRSEFSFGDHRLSKEIFMHYGHNTTVIEYTNLGAEDLLLELSPLWVCRDYHHLFNEGSQWDFRIHYTDERCIRVDPASGMPKVYLRFERGTFYPHADWYKSFRYEREKERGLDDEEDAFCAGRINGLLGPGETLRLIFSTEQDDVHGDPGLWKANEIKRLAALTTGIRASFLRDLIWSGDQFIVWRESSSSYSMIAGYHWFTDWGRDTMIAMRGLVIATGRKRVARSILHTYLFHLSDGMIPNRFPDRGASPEYNTMDATLWLFVALYEYHLAFDDLDLIDGVFDKMSAILESHFRGTRYGIHVTPEGLLYGGAEGTQLTWMDAKVGDVVVTPRRGCPVEINALWYNALSIYVFLGKALGYDTGKYTEELKKVRQAFRTFFIHPEGHLYDVVVPGRYTDASIRPNQIYAVSLPFSPLTPSQGRKVLEVVQDHLYTGYGLRSLSPKDAAYKGVFSGDQWQRDHAYHQGTVWSYLWGEFALGYLKVHGYSPLARKWVQDQSVALRKHFYDQEGICCISENFDGHHPLTGKGCIQQAWSVGMMILALVESKK